MANTQSSMVPAHTIQPGDTPAKIAAKFNTTVKELLRYNAGVLGGSFGVGTDLRDPNEIRIVVNDAYKNGATTDQIAKVLKITEEEVVSRFGASPNNKKSTKKTTQKDVPADMYRQDGSIKSAQGFLGPIKADSGKTMTEFSTDLGDEFDTQIPTIVPTQPKENIDYMKSMKPGQGWDMNNPIEQNIIQIARQHAKERISAGKSPFYVDGEEAQPEVSTNESLSATQQSKIKDILKNNDYVKAIKERTDSEVKGLSREFLQGLTLGSADEIEALMSDENYYDAFARINKEREQFKTKFGGAGLIAESVGAIPTSIGAVSGLSRLGVKSLAKQGGIEGAVYGFNTGTNEEGRIQGAAIGGLAGLALGKVIDVATSPSSKGGIKTDGDNIADDAIPEDSFNGKNRVSDDDLDPSLKNEQYTNVENPAFERQPLRDAKTAGELYEGVKTAVINFYNQKVTGTSDMLVREVSPEVGFKYDRVSTTALRNNNKDLGDIAEELVPALKAINESEEATGILLDFGAGKLGVPEYLKNRYKKAANQSERAALSTRMRKVAIDELNQRLAPLLTNDQIKSINRYIDISFKKNKEINKKLFGVEFDDDITFLHTRLTKEQKAKIKKDRGFTDEQLEDFLDDPAFQLRTRGTYTNLRDRNRPNPADYDNPIVSDMQRLFKMEQLRQIQRIYGVDISAAREAYGRALTPSEFMDVFGTTLVDKGIAPRSAAFARNAIFDTISGEARSPNPIVQALSSVAYATTLAGPLSAILNIADIPLLGAKYGGRAALEGLGSLKPFKSIPNADLKKMGLNDQSFGEFVSRVNGQAKDSVGFLNKMAESFRNGTDMLMKGSGFAAMDKVGKRGVMRGVLRSAVDDANSGKLAGDWSFYFNEDELGILTEQLKKHGMDWTKYTGRGSELVEELMFAGLGQQQLINAAGRPSAWSRNPNLRPLWALRGFVIKQQALALREVVGNIKAGKPEEAAKYLGRYAAYGAGGYAVINEGRQALFGDGEISASGLAMGYGDAWASLLTANTLGLNDYQYGQIKNNGILYTLAAGLAPVAATRPLDILGTAIDVVDQERPPQRLLTEALPIVKQTGQFIRNVSPENSDAGMLTEELLRTRNN